MVDRVKFLYVLICNCKFLCVLFMVFVFKDRIFWGFVICRGLYLVCSDVMVVLVVMYVCMVCVVSFCCMLDGSDIIFVIFFFIELEFIILN